MKPFYKGEKMKKKKILIYFPEEMIAPMGGPAGYLWNLKKGISSLSNMPIEIEFYKNYKKKNRR